MSDAKEKITDAELEVMHVLWKAEGPLTLAGIKAALCERNGDTVKTLLRGSDRCFTVSMPAAPGP